jgi:putative resolvase
MDDISSIFGQERPTRSKICYARVSSSKQKNDLDRQVNDLQILYPGHSVITDVGSALNFKRPGFLLLLDKISSNMVEEVVVLHKDRLCRFGFELVEWICSKHSTSLIVHNKAGVDCDQRELADDLLAITNYFVAKNNGRRAAKNRKERKKAELDQRIQKQTKMPFTDSQAI